MNINAPTPSTNETDARLEQLEIKIAFQEDTIGVLNDMVTGLQADVERMRETQRIIVQRLRELGDSGAPSNVIDEPPPHY